MKRRAVTEKRKRELQRERFNKAIKVAGYKDYFEQCVHQRYVDTKLNPANKDNPTRDYYCWIQEAKRWGYSTVWKPPMPIRVPPDAPLQGTTTAQLVYVKPPKSAPEPADPDAPPEIIEDVQFSEDPEFAKMIRWTLTAIGNDPDRIPPHQIPNPASLRMLRFANGKGEETFWKWVKAVEDAEAKKGEIKRSFEDDKRVHFTLIEKIIADLKRRNLENPQRIPVA